VNVEIRDERFRAVVGDDAAVEELAGGFDFTEGPVWHYSEKHLIFSDMPGNIMRKWTPDGRVQTWRQPSNMANGNAYDRDGRLVTCEHATSRVTRTERDGSITVLASHYQGKELNSPNDIIVKRDGAIYFSDPSFGRMEYFGVPRETELNFRGVYRLDPKSGTLKLLVDDFDQPNGLCFSPDEKQLFIDDTTRAHMRIFDVRDDGSIANGRIWATLSGDREGHADGMKVDSQGNLFITGPGGIHVYAPDAASLGIIYVPQVCSNFFWGEDDLKSLFITASHSLYRVRVRVPGMRMF
jgi:gluconolactonase